MSALHSPAADRNRGPILEILRRELPETGTILELASGSGQHVVHFAEHLPKLSFQPSDVSEEARASVEAYRASSGLTNVRPVARVDVLDEAWEAPFAGQIDAIVCINMVQVAPHAAIRALFEGARRLLRAKGAPLVMYGPFQFGGVFRSQGNADFHASLKARGSDLGVRDALEITDEAQKAGFVGGEPIDMPANNHVLVFRTAENAGSPRPLAEPLLG